MNYVDFGRYLTQQRELRGLSRQEVVKATKIPESVIAALEDGQVERLPARVFILNYVRAYSATIGLAAEEALLRFEEVDKAGAAAPTPQGSLARDRQRARLLAFVAGGLAVLVGLVLFLWARRAPGP